MKQGKSLKTVLIPLFVVFFFGISLNAQSTIVKGRLLDVEGRPSKFALVGYSSNVGQTGQNFVPTDEMGNYTIQITEPGQALLLYSIPNHSSLTIPVLNDRAKNLIIDVVMAPYKYKENFDDLGIMGTFNNFNMRSPEKMIKQDDGIYRFEVKSDKKEIKYELCGIESGGRSINAPESKDFEPDSSGDYRSVIKIQDGKGIILFDPSKLLKKDVDPKININGSDYDEKVYKHFTEYSKLLIDINQNRQAYSAAGKDTKKYEYDAGSYIPDLINKIETETDPGFRDYLKLVYISLTIYKVKGIDPDKGTLFFNSISPENYLWDLIPTAFSANSMLFPKSSLDDLHDRFLKMTRSKTIKYAILVNRLAGAKYKNDMAEVKKLHALISTDYKDIKELQQMLKYFPVESLVNIGKEVPDFETASLDNPSEIISRKNMLGRVYLIDFWATWCGPCVGEMENLHKAYDLYKDKGFQIVSLSLDTKSDDVAKFRDKKWKMPWKNGFLGDQEGKKIIDRFEVTSIPKPILVGADGKVLELTNGLRGDELVKTLAKYLN